MNQNKTTTEQPVQLNQLTDRSTGIHLTPAIYFISGIDTDIGKTYATAWLAQQLIQQDKRVITQKLVQTGCDGMAEDILRHRHLTQMPLTPEDQQGLTAPVVLPYPCSPHLASQLCNTPIDLDSITAATEQLASRYPVVLIEGAGGLMVPLGSQTLCIDYLQQQGYPVILVTSGRLGSLNHTLLSLLALQQYQIELYALVFNAIHDHRDSLIANDSRRYLHNYLKQHFPNAHWWQMPVMTAQDTDTKG